MNKILRKLGKNLKKCLTSADEERIKVIGRKAANLQLLDKYGF